MSVQQFERMAEQIAALRPDLDACAITHACNLVSNQLRQAKMDIYDVLLANEQLPSQSGYYIDRAVEVHGRLLWLRAWVD